MHFTLRLLVLACPNSFLLCHSLAPPTPGDAFKPTRAAAGRASRAGLSTQVHAQRPRKLGGCLVFVVWLVSFFFKKKEKIKQVDLSCGCEGCLGIVGGRTCYKMGNLSLSLGPFWDPSMWGWLVSADLAGGASWGSRSPRRVCRLPSGSLLSVVTRPPQITTGRPLLSPGPMAPQCSVQGCPDPLPSKASVLLGPRRKPRASESMQ